MKGITFQFFNGFNHTGDDGKEWAFSPIPNIDIYYSKGYKAIDLTFLFWTLTIEKDTFRA